MSAHKISEYQKSVAPIIWTLPPRSNILKVKNEKFLSPHRIRIYERSHTLPSCFSFDNIFKQLPIQPSIVMVVVLGGKKRDSSLKVITANQ